MFNYIWEKEDVNAKNIKPKHDEFSHGADAIRYLTVIASKMDNDFEPIHRPPRPTAFKF